MATIPSFRTWTAGEVVTAAFMNSNVRDAGNFFLSWPVCEARQTVAQSIATFPSAVGLLFDLNDIDTDNGHSTSTNTSRYVAKTQGRFQVCGKYGTNANATGARFVYIARNGTAVNGSDVAVNATAGGGVTSITTPCMSVFLNGSTDYVEIIPQQSSGGALNTNVTAQDQSIMSVRMVGTT